LGKPLIILIEIVIFTKVALQKINEKAQMKMILTFLVIVLLTASCKKSDAPKPSFTETKIDLITHKLMSFSAIKNAK
jgi:hypothetical protein